MPRNDRDWATGKPVDFNKPEEPVRQEYEHVLVESYNYRKNELDIEVRIPRGSGFFPDKADIVVYDSSTGRDPAEHIIGIVETKKPGERSGMDQLKSYMTATSAVWGVWTNAEDITYFYKQGNRIIEGYLNNIPIRGQSVEDVGRLSKADLRPFNRNELKAAFRRIHLTLYANTNISRSEKLGSEMIKIIFAKLEDEGTYTDQPPMFRAEAGENARQVANRIKALFHRVRQTLIQDGIFTEHEEISLDDRSIAWVVGQLERGSLLTTESDVVGDAFEVFSESKFIGEKGEFFTPRNVVRLAVRLANPTPGDTVCDPACGSGGFLIYAMKHVWGIMENDPRWRGSSELNERKRHMAASSFYGIDKETDLVKISKAHMAIAGDGRSNIVHENALHSASEFEGESQRHFVTDEQQFKPFDVILTNPPFGTEAKVLRDESAKFELGHKWRKQGSEWEITDEPCERDPYVLFVERCLDLLKDEGILGIVLPETVFHGKKIAYLRDYVISTNNIKAIIDLPHNTFRPHCNAKTCLLIIQKGTNQQDQVVMATPDEMGHDHQGNTLYKLGTEEVWDDLGVVYDELSHPDSPENRFVFTVDRDQLDSDLLVPRYYRWLENEVPMPEDCDGVTIDELISDGTLTSFDGHGSPEAKWKGEGDVPYMRVSDIVNWELYRNPVSGIPEHVYESLVGTKETSETGDVIFVRRGSYRIGTVAMASHRDSKVLLTRELLTFRVTNPNNRHGITPFYLIAMLSSKTIQDQIHDLVCYDTTLPNLGDRWKLLTLPVHRDSEEINRISQEVEEVIRAKWSAQDSIDELRNRLGSIIT